MLRFNTYIFNNSTTLNNRKKIETNFKIKSIYLRLIQLYEKHVKYCRILQQFIAKLCDTKQVYKPSQFSLKSFSKNKFEKLLKSL